MKIKVPFYASKKDTDCGPMVLKMALAYLGEEHSFEELSKLELQIDTGLVWSLGIARAAKMLGFPTKIISKTNFSHDEDIEFYKKFKGDKGMLILNKLKKEIKKLKIIVEEKDLSLNDLLSFVSKDSIPIVLVSWNVLKNKEGFQGHYLILTGYNKKNIYVHNPGIEKAAAYMPIEKELFKKMWEHKGTDKDTIIIYKKL